MTIDSTVTPETEGQPSLPRTYVVHTYGCQMNEHDSERISGLLEADGLTRVERNEDADVIVFNTCTIRENADNRLYGNLGHMKQIKDANPLVQIVVAGCQAQKDQGLIQQRAPWVDVVFGTHNVHRAAELLREARVNGPIMEILAEAEQFPSAIPVRRDEAWSAWVTIQMGCDNSCAFCIVPSVRGVEISRPFADLLDEVRTLAAAGTVEITLLGQNVNSYGRDLTTQWRTRTDWNSAEAVDACGERWALDERGPRARPLFSDLLRAVGSIEGVKRVRYTSPHPKDMRTETFAAMLETPTVMPHLHFPLQSGSDRILSEMHRGYTSARYKEKIAEARAAMPGIAVTSDIIVGFPGETEEDFQATMALVAEVEFDSVYTFEFSARPGTAAWDMADRFVPEAVIRERFERLKIVADRAALKKNEAHVGSVEEVLVEGPSKRDESVTSARTKQNKLVHFAYLDGDGIQRALPAGTFATVRIVSAAPYFMRAEFIEIVAKHRHRTRLAVTAV
jgi:tRNA-2-methylthio-N6-dimethylallyladenosine synthase